MRDAGAAPDERMRDAVRIVAERRQADGTWPLDATDAEALAFPFPDPVGEPSRWNSLRALRVLRWYEAGPPLTSR